MIEREHHSTEAQRAREIEWLNEHLDAFWGFASEGLHEEGRGVMVADTRQVVEVEGVKTHPILYVPESWLHEIPWTQEQEIARLVGEYEPGWEMIAVLVKSDSESVYRLGVYLQDDLRMGMREA